MIKLGSRGLALAAICGALLAGCDSRNRDAPRTATPPATVGRGEEIEALIERLATSQEAATDRPVYTPSVSTPADDPRVQAYEAVSRLKGFGKDAFPHLLQHLDDGRQSVCLRRAVPCTVGYACFNIIEDVVFPLPYDYRGSFGRVGADGEMHARVLFSAPGPFDADTVADWLAARANRTLREIQVEAIEWLIAQETAIGFPTSEDVEAYLRPLERQLALLEAQADDGVAELRTRMPPPCGAEEIQRWIDALVEVSESDVGYSATMTGMRFLPVDAKAQFGMGLLGQPAPVASDALRRLVECGADALPHLISHLDDARPTRMELKHESLIGLMRLGTEYDYNRRTSKSAPPDVNQDDFLDSSKYIKRHTVTVGDLCFVALGQIVNRHFDAVRYQPTANIVVNSPVHSAPLRAAVLSEWSGVDAERHLRSLVEDARRPDHAGRREGAIKRLAYYHPQVAEQLVMEILDTPRYCGFRVERFARERLYTTDDPDRWRASCAEFLDAHGPPFRDALLLKLLDDHDWDRRHPKPDWRGDPRTILGLLFPEVDAAKPVFVDSISQSDLARFIDSFAALASRPVDEKVLALFRSLGDTRFEGHNDEYLALACIRRLIGKGHDEELRAYCRRHTDAQYHGHEFRELLDRMKGTAAP